MKWNKNALRALLALAVRSTLFIVSGCYFGVRDWLSRQPEFEQEMGGGLRRLIEEDGRRGVTSNPAIFEKAIADGREYDKDSGFTP